jgi:nucleoside-diphosphate-sugar epimerase
LSRESDIKQLLNRSSLPPEDIKEIISNSQPSLEQLSKSEILIAGGTGFVGQWLVTTLIEASKVYNIKVHLLVRNRDKANAIFANMDNSNLQLIPVDKEIQLRCLTHIIHAATPSTPATGGSDSVYTFDVATRMAKRLIEVAGQNITPTFMHLSSGAVYGEKPVEKRYMLESEEIQSSPQDYYATSKIEIERQVSIAHNAGLINGTNPRLFAFTGPGIALDAHFAIGNFMRDAINGNRIHVLGNPNTTRSYLYPVDMITWLLAALSKPSMESTHIGSNHGYTMQSIGELISHEFNLPELEAGSKLSPTTFYVPDTSRSRARLQVNQTISLEEAISRWRGWLEN